VFVGVAVLVLVGVGVGVLVLVGVGVGVACTMALVDSWLSCDPAEAPSMVFTDV
jgi:hypothetical protein